MAIPDPATTEWVPIWNPISQGPVGPAGPSGPTGPTGPQGPAGVAGPHHAQHERGGSDEVLFATGLFERGRAVQMGSWITNAFNAASFTAAAGAWTVTAGNVQANRYTLIGNTIIWTLNVTTSNLSVATDTVFVALPAGFNGGPVINMGASRAAYVVSAGVNQPGVLVSTIGDTRVRLFNVLGNFAAGDLATYLTFTGEIG